MQKNLNECKLSSFIFLEAALIKGLGCCNASFSLLWEESLITRKSAETTIRLSEKPLEIVKRICQGEESGSIAQSWGNVKATSGAQIPVSERALHPFEIHSCGHSLEAGTSLRGVKV